MPDRLQPVFRIVCLALGGLVIYQLVFLAFGKSPVAGIVVPNAPYVPEPAAADTPEKKAESAAPSNSPPQAAMPPNMPMPMPAGMPGMPPGRMPPGMMPPGFRGGPGGAPQPALPPEIQSRIDKIVKSEILGPIHRPLPMALLGIAGEDVFLRTPNGQTGLVRKGGEMGGVKILQVGTNRVLVEADGEKKELTIFSGFGSESLSSSEKEVSK